MNWGDKISARLFAPVDIAGLVAFRIMFGMMMAIDTARYVSFGWLHSHYLDPPFLLKYMGFHWVHPVSTGFLYGVFGMMIAVSVCIAIGAYYRLSCFLFFLGHTFVFLLAASHYLNHAYLISLWSLLMVFVPAHRALSIDLLRRPELHRTKIHAWPYWLLCGTMTVVYVFGGIAKINPDWLAGEPIRHWMGHSARQAPFLRDFIRSETYVQLVMVFGLLFDLLIVPLLCWRPTRVFAALLSAGFHASNAYLFNIGIFPWFGLGATTLFFNPSWPRKLPQLGPDLAMGIDQWRANSKATANKPPAVSSRKRRRIIAALGAYGLVQILIPLRHHLYPGYVAWNEAGHYFSWRMKLRDKQGTMVFKLRDSASGREWKVRPDGQLTERQVRKINCRPDLLLQYAHYLRETYQRNDGLDVQVRADVFCALNYRPRQRFVDPEVDLGREPASLGHYDWVLPFKDSAKPRSVATLNSGLSAKLIPRKRKFNRTRNRAKY